jgi:DNA-binding transcriptional ArsR family regulator
MDTRKDYSAALALRLEGKTYGEIRRNFKIPKSTLSGWFSALKINNKAKKILESKKKNGYYKLVEFNKTRTLDILKENENIRKEYESRVNRLSERELMILGAALYWGEGYKNFNQKKFVYPYICLGNSDPEMIITFIHFLEKILGITKDRIKAPIFIYPGMIPEEAINYWQKLTNIPRENFRCQMALSRASQGKRPKNLLPYGTLQLRVIKRQEFFKIRGLIDGIIKNL